MPPADPPARPSTKTSSAFATSRRDVAACLAIAAAVLAVGWPGLGGFWGRDDFMQLAMARLLDSPWPLFFNDHFVAAPGAVFRPLGFASFWAGEALFGSDYAAHALSSLALHTLVAIGVFAVARAGGIGRLPALAGALVFAAHPAATGTALWWSARFDVLAALFGLWAIACALHGRHGPRAVLVPLTLAALMASMLAKEIGLVAVAAVVAVWLGRARTGPTRRRALIYSVLAAAAAGIFLVWRAAVLNTFGSSLTGAQSLPEALLSGTAGWLAMAPDYLSWWPRLRVSGRIVVVAALVVLVVCTVAGRRGNRSVKEERPSPGVLACGVVLALLPAVLQAPIVILNAAALDPEMSAVEAAMQSRLFYLALTGIGLLVAALLHPLFQSRQAWSSRSAGAALLGLIATSALVSHAHAVRFAQRSAEIGTVAQQAVAAVSTLDLPNERCHVMFVDVPTPPEWEIYVAMDSIIKAIHPDLDRVGHCFFHADHRTFFHLFDSRPDPADYPPFKPLQIGGTEVQPMRVGNLTAVYLQAGDGVPTGSMPVLTYRGDRFVPRTEGRD